MKIVLIHPNVTRLGEISNYSYSRVIARKSRRKRIAPTGLLMLKVNSKYESHFIDNRFDRLSDEVLAFRCLETIGNGPGVVAFGGTCMEWAQAASVASLVKSKRPNITTVYGGPNATARPEKHAEFFDYVVSGFGIESFGGLVDRLVYGGNPNLPGTGVSQTGIIQPPCFPDSIDQYKWPKQSDVPERYHRCYNFNTVITSIGCPFACRFCSSQTIWQRHVFYRDIDDVMREIHGKRIVDFRDDNFTSNRKRLLEFCGELKRAGIRWSCQSRVSTLLDEDVVNVMRESRCRKVSCGFESANDSTLEAIGKGHTFEQIKQVKLNCKRAGIRIVGGWVVGFPNEGEAEIKRTVKAAKGKVAPLLGFPTSAIYHQMINEGLVEYDWQDGEVLFPGTRTLSRERVEQLARGMS